MVEAATASWKCGANGPTTVTELRVALTALAKRKSGGHLISTKFHEDHIFAGHAGDVKKISAMLARLRLSAPLSTYMVSSMLATAQKEVLNWIENVPAGKLTHSNGTWKIDKSGTTVKAASSYKFATVDLAALKGMDKDDIVKKSRNWLTESSSTPKVACLFAKDGTPVIYHLDF